MWVLLRVEHEVLTTTPRGARRRRTREREVKLGGGDARAACVLPSAAGSEDSTGDELNNPLLMR
jgi:hypothetical protein